MGHPFGPTQSSPWPAGAVVFPVILPGIPGGLIPPGFVVAVLLFSVIRRSRFVRGSMSVIVLLPDSDDARHRRSRRAPPAFPLACTLPLFADHPAACDTCHPQSADSLRLLVTGCHHRHADIRILRHDPRITPARHVLIYRRTAIGLRWLGQIILSAYTSPCPGIVAGPTIPGLFSPDNASCFSISSTRNANSGLDSTAPGLPGSMGAVADRSKACCGISPVLLSVNEFNCV